MRLMVQKKALQAAEGWRLVMPVVRKRDRLLFEQIHKAMNSVVLNLAEADGNDPGTSKARFASACGSAKEVRGGLQLAVAYGYLPSSKVREVDSTLPDAFGGSLSHPTAPTLSPKVCAMSWRLSGR